MKARRYPWKEWFGKHKFALIKGGDFDIECEVMDQTLRNQATRRGVPISIHRQGDVLMVVLPGNAPRSEVWGEGNESQAPQRQEPR